MESPLNDREPRDAAAIQHLEERIRTAIWEGKRWLVVDQHARSLNDAVLHLDYTKGKCIDFIVNRAGDSGNYQLSHFESVQEALEIITFKNLSIMNENNFAYLKENLKYAGFGEKANEMLRIELEKQQPEFRVTLQGELNKQAVQTTLHFKKSNETDMYFFNKYAITLKPEKSAQELSQTFYINQGHGVTFKEGYNLLNGRSVYKELENKEGAKYHAWIKLNFAEKDNQGNFKRHLYHENYGYQVADALAKYPIKELLEETSKAELIRSLQRGNIQVVTFEKNGLAERLMVEANPQFKTVNIYDMKTGRIQAQELHEKYGQSMNGKEQSTKQEVKTSAKQEGSDEDGPGSQQQKKRGRKRGQSMA